MMNQGLKSVFQELLYREPLFQFIGKQERNMNVLVLGGDEAALMFVDQCLQAGQMTAHALSITVLAENAALVRREYLSARPALADFVNVNGSLSKRTIKTSAHGNEEAEQEISSEAVSEAEASAEAYAVLDFVGLSKEEQSKLFSDKRELMEEQLIDILSQAPDEKYHYFLISLGDNAVNQRLAACLTQVLGELMPSEPGAVHYIMDNSFVSGQEANSFAFGLDVERQEANSSASVQEAEGTEVPRNVAPVPEEGAIYQGGVIFTEYEEGPSLIDPELERMAFNADQAWSDSINGNLLNEWEEFKRDSYRYQSSTAFALSIRYKLADLDIPLDDPSVAADAFAAALENSWKRPLAAHRRQDEPDIKKTLRVGPALANDELLNQIIALEHRRWVLEKVTEGWTAPDPDQMEAFYEDCLVRCKVNDKEKKIHPCIVRSTTATPLSTGAYSRDRSCWDRDREDPEEIEARDELDRSLDPLDRMSVELHRFMHAKAKRFKDTDPVKKGVIADIRGILESEGLKDRRMRKWEHFVYCVENILDGSRAYAKQYGLYKERFLAVTGGCSEEAKAQIGEKLALLDREIWPAIESAMYRDYKKYDDTLVRKISFILTYRMNLTLAAPFQISDSVYKMNHIMFQNTASATVIKPGKILWLLYLDSDASEELVRPMVRRSANYLKSKGIYCQKQFCVIGSPEISEEERELWERSFNKMVKDGVITSFCLQFDKDSREAASAFREYLAQEKPDLFDGTSALFSSALENARFLAKMEEDLPYFEFESARKRFSHNEKCRYLSYISDHTYLGIEEMFGLAGAEDIEFDYPIFGREYRHLWSIYVGKNRSGSSRTLAVKNWNDLCRALEKYEESKIDKKSGKKPCISQINLSELKKKYTGGDDHAWDNVVEIIEELTGEKSGKRYLIPIRENGRLTGFRYTGEDIHSLLTKAGSILEICIYFEVCRLGYFDDASCGYEFRWTEGNIKNEFDLVLTKGFQSVIVECKAAREIKQEYYFKLNSLADLFGINAYQVLLTNRETDKGDNKVQKRRGTLMGVVTITETDDIAEMARKLVELVEEA
ncbi:MAG: hypothetical protein LUI87_08620 [Lachnospiraceae bacterium]|nr:hypothetical protein [Lachnospiraceae bacterium]